QLAMIGISHCESNHHVRSDCSMLAGTSGGLYFFSRTYDPLMKFIALRSIDRDRAAESDESPLRHQPCLHLHNGNGTLYPSDLGDRT
ncbi:hypothetical protein CISG_06443, partial [Coccidioides immitis RMSCC 3703]